MSKSIQKKDILVVGFAMFSIFFGAGNLIFPPFLGAFSKNKFWIASIGFCLTAVGLTFLGVLAAAKSGCTIEGFGKRIGDRFSKILEAIIILCVGPLVGIPRTGATTYEVGISTLFPNVPTFVGVGIFFLLTCLICLKKAKVIDRLGTILTPMLLLMMILMITKGILSPVSPLEPAEVANIFAESLATGYQTMDAIVAIVITGWIYNNLLAKGYRGQKTLQMIGYCGTVAVTLLVGIYGGLAYLGATSDLDYRVLDQTRLLVIMTRNLWGKAGAGILAIAISLACLTTSTGLLTMTADYFYRLLKEKIHYSIFVIAVSIFVTCVALLRVDQIIQIATPILKVIYPTVIMLIFCNLLERWIPNDIFVKVSAYTALIISLLQVLRIRWIAYLPLAKYELAWIFPSIVCSFIAGTIYEKRKSHELH